MGALKLGLPLPHKLPCVCVCVCARARARVCIYNIVCVAHHVMIQAILDHVMVVDLVWFPLSSLTVTK